MSDFMFDTLRYSNMLIAGGIPKAQAEAQVEALFAVIDNQLATKSDLKELRLEFKNDLLIKIGGMFGFSIAAIGVLFSIFH